MYCRYCGEKLNENADLCLKCGKYVSKDSNNKVSQTGKKKKTKLILAITIPLAVVVCFVGALIISVLAITSSDEYQASDALITSMNTYPDYYPLNTRVVSGNVSRSKDAYYLRIYGYNGSRRVDVCYKIYKDSPYPQEFYDKSLCDNQFYNDHYLDIDLVNEYLNENLASGVEIGPYY